ncbi:MerR family transcriptional regulator [Sulfitobacter sp. S190]|uniref:MerR family transcriptional regulator n=1 Tax=Sulfitobacter sp. S190 TaxID=2867022 RepID=UPI0021A8C1B3|nr:MerR family transcriptional regulator [Sulfitobacter sp. S190]UWR22631.1 MerR family transcriptional regulator [Sulfitobacter sp. S190]
MMNLSPRELTKLIHERSFSTDELVSFSGVDPFTFRNWLKRGVINVGQKHRVGRWLFSPADIIRVSTVVDLVNDIGVSPAAANTLADAVLWFLETYIERAEEHRSAPDWDGFSVLPVPMENFVVLATISGSEVSWGGYYWTEKMQLKFGFGPRRKPKATKALLQLTHVSVGAGVIIQDVMTKVRDAMSKAGATTEQPAVKRSSPVPDDPA